jgi:Fic family protein
LSNAPEPTIAEVQTRYKAHLVALNRAATQRVDFDFAQLYPAAADVETLLAQVDDLKRCLDSFRPFEPTQIANLEQALSVAYTYESNRIEGNTLTLQETTLILEKGVTIGGKSLREHLEVTGHAQAFDYVRQILQGETEFSDWVLRNIHQLVLGGVDRQNAGVYRSIDVAISGSRHEPPPSYLVPERMEAYFAEYRRARPSQHPALLAADLHEQLVAIHPFVDGNGRTARLVMNLVLLRAGYPLANLSGEQSQRLAYYDALETAHLTGNRQPFRVFVLQAVKQAAMWYLQRISTIEDSTKGVYFFQRIAPYLP